MVPGASPYEDVVLNNVAQAIEVAAPAASDRIMHDVVLDQDSRAAIIEGDAFARAPGLGGMHVVNVVVPQDGARRDAQAV